VSEKFETTCILYMTDVRDEEPTSGSRVLALQHGGRTIETTWNSDSHKEFYAWCPFPKIKQKTKDRMMEKYVDGTTD
jgi:hypothetical protein